MSKFFNKKLKGFPLRIFVALLLLSFSTLLFLTSEIKSQTEEATGSASEASESAQVTDQTAENEQKALAAPWKEIQGTYIATGEKLISENIDPSGKFFSDELIVQFKDSVADEEKAQVLSEKDLTTKMVSYYSKAHLVRVDSNQREKVMEELSSDPRVERVGHNDVLKGITIPREEPNDSYFVNDSQYGLEKIKAPEAWSVTKGSGEKYIAVIDTGVNYNHEDLQGKVILGRNFTTDGDQCDPMDNDVNSSHGTRIAGIAAAVTNNGKGVAGVAWNPKIVAIKVGVEAHINPDGSGGFGVLEVAEGINYAVNPYPSPYGCDDVPKADVISLSINGSDSGHYIRDAVDEALSQHVVVVAGVDNNRDTGDCSMGYPAAHPGVISVGGTNMDDSFSSGCHQPDSQSDDNGYTLTAPEKDIYSPVRSGGYGADSGTSLATPAVAAALATYLSSSISPNPSDPNYLNLIRGHLIIGGVDDLGPPGYDQVYGWGRLNFCKLVSGSCPPSVSMYVSTDWTNRYQHIQSVNVGQTFYVTVKAESGVSGPYVTLSGIYLYDFYQQKWFYQVCGQDICEHTWTWFFDSGASGINNGLIAGALDTAGNSDFSHSSAASPYRVYVFSNNYSNSAALNGSSLPSHLNGLTTSSGSVIVNLNWTDTSRESAFHLQKSIEGGIFSDFKELSADTTSYSDTLPSSQEGKHLTYRVRARFSDNSYSVSNEQSIDAPIVTPPSTTLRVTTSCDNRKVHYHLEWNDLPNETGYTLAYWTIKTITLPANTTSYDYTDLDQPSIPANMVFWGLRADLSGGGFVYSGNVYAPATDCGGGNLNLSIATTCDQGKVHFWLAWGSIEGASFYKVGESTGGPYEVFAVITQTSLDYRSEFSSISANQVGFFLEAWDNSQQLQVSQRYAPATSCPAPPTPTPTPTPTPPPHQPNYEANVIYLRGGNGLNNVFYPGETVTARIDWYIDTGYPYYYGGWNLGFFNNCANYDGNCSGDPLTWEGTIDCKASGCNGSTEVTFTVPFAPGTYKVAAIGDRLNQITEFYENDNKAYSNYTVAGSSQFTVSYHCAEDGFPVADLSWPPAPAYHPQDQYADLQYYEIEYKDPDNSNWWYAANELPQSPFITIGAGVGPTLQSGETWGWRVKTHYSAHAGTLDWVGPIYASIPHCSPPPPCPCNSFGDVNNDSKITQGDLDLISQYIAGQTSFTDEQKRRADVTGDGNINQADLDKITAYFDSAVTTFPVCEDADNDGLPNYQDQDDDNDGFSDTAERYIGTNPALKCGLNAWPPDINNDGTVSILDVLLYKPKLNGPYNKRYDLNTDGQVSIIDILLYKPLLGKTCSN